MICEMPFDVDHTLMHYLVAAAKRFVLLYQQTDGASIEGKYKSVPIDLNSF